MKGHISRWSPGDFTPEGIPGPSGDACRPGYVYAIQFSTDLVKVGRSANPRKRITAHANNAEPFRISVVGAWVSLPHDNYEENEEYLILFASWYCSEAIRNEYFTGLNFAAVAEFGGMLECEAADVPREGVLRARGQVPQFDQYALGEYLGCHARYVRKQCAEAGWPHIGTPVDPAFTWAHVTEILRLGSHWPGQPERPYPARLVRAES